MNFKKIVSSIGIGAGAIIIGLGIQYALAQTAGTWSPPGTGYPAGTNCTPPNCNVPAPINVGNNWQEKLGSLTVGTSNPCNKDASGNCITLDVGSGGGLFNSLGVISQLVYGGSGSSVTSLGGLAPAKGEVLTALDANGTVGWRTPVTGTAGYQNIVSYGYTSATNGLISTNGIYTWVAPAGITSAQVTVVGGGGSGSYGYTVGQQEGDCAGGGGGGTAQSIISVTPGTSYNITVGTTGGTSSFGPVSGAVVSASGGGNGIANYNAIGGTGGTATGQTGGAGSPGSAAYGNNTSCVGGSPGGGGSTVVYSSHNGTGGTFVVGANGQVTLEY
jgi:hypothetical protein